MSENREKAKSLLHQLNKLLKLEIKNAEVTGSNAEELGGLLKLYPSYLATMTKILPLLNGPIAQVDFDAIRASIAEHRTVMDGLPMLKTYSMFNDGNNRLGKVDRLLDAAESLLKAEGGWPNLTRFDQSHFHGMVTEAFSKAAGNSEGDGDEAPQLALEQLKAFMDHSPEGIAAAVDDAQCRADLRAELVAATATLQQQPPLAGNELSDEVVSLAATLEQHIERLDRLISSAAIDADASGAEDGASHDVLSQCEAAIAFIAQWRQGRDDFAALQRLQSTPSITNSLSEFAPQISSASASLAGIARSVTEEKTSVGTLARSELLQDNVRAILSHVKAVKDGIDAIVADARAVFPRLLAYSDEDVLSLKGATSADDLPGCAEHVQRLFPGWHSLVPADSTDAAGLIAGVRGVSGEVLEFAEPLSVSGPITNWLHKLETAAAATLKDQFAKLRGRMQAVVMGTGEVDAALFDNCCTQVGVIGLHSLYTSLVEAMIARHGRPSPNAAAQSDSAATGGGTGEPEHFGPRRPATAARPGSAAARASSASRLRPGSAIARLSTLTTIADAGSPTRGDRPASATTKKGQAASRGKKGQDADDPRSRAAAAAALRGRDTPGLTGAADEVNAATQTAAQQQRTSNIRDRQMTAASKGRLQRVFNQVTSQLLRLLAKAESARDRARVVAWLATQHRLNQAWEQSIRTLTSTLDSRWIREPRVYASASGSTVSFDMGVFKADYGWHFDGNAAAFLLTPAHHDLWERMAATLVTHRGALVAGQGADGKASTVRSMALLCGRAIIPLTATSATTPAEAANFVRSVASSGAWGLVTEAGNLSSETQTELSRCSAAVLGALGRRQASVAVGGRSFPVAPNGFGLVATTSKLAGVLDDMRGAFRCCFLPRPDMHFVAQAALSCHGFREAAALAGRLKGVCDVVGQLLTETPRPRVLGMAALMGLARHAGSLRPTMAAATEEHVLVRALHEYWRPRFEWADLPVLGKVLGPIQEKTSNTSEFHTMAAAVEARMVSQKLRASPEAIERVITLHRWAVADADCTAPIYVCGPTGTGKTTLLHATAELAKEANNRPRPEVVMLNADDVDAATSMIAANKPTASKPLWLSVKNPKPAVLSALNDAMHVPFVRVFVECHTCHFVGEKDLAVARLLSTVPTSIMAAWRSVIDHAAAKDPHVWQRAVVNEMTELANKHLDAILAAAQVKGSPYALTSWFVACVTALLVSMPTRTALASERLFWVAATWSIGGAPSKAWNDFVAQAADAERTGLVEVGSVFPQADGELALWSEVTSQQLGSDGAFLAYTPAVARALHIASLQLQWQNAVAIVGPARSAKSLLVRRLAADRGYSLYATSSGDLRNVLEEARNSAKAMVVVDNDAPLSPEVVDLVTGFVSSKPHPRPGVTFPAGARLVFICREVPSELREFLVPVVIEAPASVGVCSVVAKDAKLDGGVVASFANLSSAMMADGAVPYTLSDAVTCVEALRTTDRMLTPAEVSTLVRAVIGMRAAPVLNERSAIRRILADNGLNDDVGESAYFYSHGQVSKRLLKADREGVEGALRSAAFPGELLSHHTLRCFEAVSCAFTVGRPVVLVGPMTQLSHEIIAAASVLLQDRGYRTAWTKEAPKVISVDRYTELFEHTSSGAFVLDNATDLSAEQWDRVIRSFRDVDRVRTQRVLVVSSLDCLPDAVVAELSARAAVLHTEPVGDNHFQLATKNCADPMRQLASLFAEHHLLRHVSWTDAAALVEWHSARSSEAFAHWNREIHDRHKQLRFAQRVLLDLQGKPPISSTEANYSPDGTELGLRAFEGTCEYNAYPEGGVRMLMKISEANEKYTDLQHCTTWYAAPAMDILQPPGVVGGQCRGRVDGNKFVLQTGTFDFHVTPTPSDDGSGELQLHGDVLEGATVIGRCYLKEVVSDMALSRQWVRYGFEIPEEEETMPPELPDPATLEMTAEDLQRIFTNVQNTLKKLLPNLDRHLRDAVLTDRDVSDRLICAALFPAAAALSVEDRVALDAEVRDEFANASGRSLPSLLSNEVGASVLGISDVQLADWLLKQRANGLPPGPDAASAAIAVRAFSEGNLPRRQPVLVVDPWSQMTGWLRSIEGSTVVSAAQAVAGTVESISMSIVTGVTAASHLDVCSRLGHDFKHVLVTHDPDAVATWARSRYTVVDCSPSKLALERQFQAQGLAISNDATVIKNASTALAKAVVAEQATKRGYGTIVATMAERVSIAASNDGKRSEAYTALNEAAIPAAIVDIEKARTDLNEASAYVTPTPQAQKEVAELQPLAKRLASLTAATESCMVGINANYAALHTARMTRAKDILVSGTRNLENATRTFLTPFVASLLEADRVAFAGMVALHVASDNGVTTADDFHSMVASFRRPDTAAQAAFERREQDDYLVAVREAEQRDRLAAEAQAQPVSTGKGKSKVKVSTAPQQQSSASQIQRSPLLQPGYAAIDMDTWVRILAVHRRFPTWFGQLPAAFHDGTPGNGTHGAKATKWQDWFDNVGATGASSLAPPTYEKDSLPGVAKALLLLAARPNRALPALRLLAADMAGAEWADGLDNPDDLTANVVAADIETQSSLPIVLACPAGLPTNQLTSLAAAACTRRKISLYQEADDAAKGKAKQGKAAAAAAAESASVVIYRNGTQPAAALVAAVKLAATNSNWLLIDRVHEATADTLRAVLSTIAATHDDAHFRVLLAFDFTQTTDAAGVVARTAIPRVAVASTSGLKEALRHTYTNVINEGVLSSFPRPEWRHLVFLVSYVAAAVDQRLRFLTSQPTGGAPAHRSEGDLSSAVALLSQMSKSAPSGAEALPWDEVRESIACVVGSGLPDGASKDVVRAYVDWLLHPEVIEGAQSGNLTLGNLSVPSGGDLQAQQAAINALTTGNEYPEHYGLHAAAEVRVKEQENARMWQCLEEALPASGAADGSSAATWAEHALELLPRWSPDDVGALLCRSHRDSSLQTDVLAMEVLALVDTCAVARRDLLELSDDTRRAVAVNRTPSSWMARYPIRDLPSWLHVVRQADAQLRLWAAGNSVPVGMCTGLLAFPERAVAAFVADCMAQKQGATLVPYMHLVRTDDALMSPALNSEPSLLLSQLALDGASLDDQSKLVDLRSASGSGHQMPSHSVRVVAVPLPGVAAPTVESDSDDEFSTLAATASRRNVFLTRSRPMSATRSVAAPVRPMLRRPPSPPAPPQQKSAPAEEAHAYYAPLYRSSRRGSEELIGNVRISATSEHNHWVLRGTALHATV